jgi:hypothetical protein
MRLTEQDLLETLATALQEADDIFREPESFREAGVLTRDTGMVVKTRSGQTFHVTIQEA